MGGTPVTPQIIRTLNASYDGRAVTLEQLVNETGIEAKSVQSAMQRMARVGEVHVEVIQRGQVWRYSSEAPAEVVYDVAPEQMEAEDSSFEVVGKTSAEGVTVVRGNETGLLYQVVLL